MSELLSIADKPLTPNRGLIVSVSLLALTFCPTGVGFSEVLELLLKKTPIPDYDAPIPVQISGKVVIQAHGKITGAGGVSVTDGYSVVKTDAQGAFTLTPDASAVFIYITRPSGYDVVGDWYRPLAASVDFTLKPAARNEDEYTFVHVTDTHISENRRSLEGLSRFVKEVNALIPKPRFVLNSGDLLNLHKALLNTPASGHAAFRNYVGIMNHLSMPSYNVAGDHTDSSYRITEFPRGDHRCAKAMYWEYLGPHFFSFEYGKIHFMSVDFGYHLGKRKIKVNGKELDYPTNEVQPMHTKWMRQDMSHRSPGSFVVTSAESDLTKHCPGFLDMAKQHDVRFQLTGDIHVVSEKKRPVPYRTGGALAGCWWNPKANKLCPDLSPQGYMIYRVNGEQLEHFYKGLGQRVSVVSHRVGAPLKGMVEFKAHLVQPRPEEKLEFSIDGKPWAQMRVVDKPFYRTLYAAKVDSTSLPEGLLELSFRTTSTGEIRTRTFVVVNGREANAFKTDAPLKFTVSPSNGWTTPRAPAGKVEVLFNEKVVGVLHPKARGEQSFQIPAKYLRKANTLSFRFAKPGDGMSLTSPVLILNGAVIRDPRDEAVRKVKIGHWGKKAADWGGYIAGNAEPPDETPFHRRQNVFCFVLSDAD
jgi:hypothetical protein